MCNDGVSGGALGPGRCERRTHSLAGAFLCSWTVHNPFQVRLSQPCDNTIVPRGKGNTLPQTITNTGQVKLSMAIEKELNIMKKIIGIALALALVMGVAAFAEATTDPVPATPAVTEEATTPTEEATEEAPAADDNAALQDALDAYRAAKQDKAVSDLEEELNGYVAAGSMTQEQADLILKNVKERLAERNGECPNCGYQFSKGGMKGQQGRMGGQRGSMNGQQRGGNMGSQKNGQQAPNGQMPQMPGMVPQM